MYGAEIQYRQQRLTKAYRNSQAVRVLPRLTHRHHSGPARPDQRF